MTAARTPTRRFALASVVAAVLLGAAACGSGDDDTAGDEVASLDEGGDETTDGTTDGTAAADAPEDVEEAVLAFAECMREHGIDMPDPEVNGDGGVAIAVNGDNGATEAEMDKAHEECEPLMANARGREMERDPEEQAEMEARMLEFAQCMRDHGIDMPDPEFDGDGRVTMRAGAGDEGALPVERDTEAFEAAAAECGQDGGGFIAGPVGGEGPSNETNEDG